MKITLLEKAKEEQKYLRKFGDNYFSPSNYLIDLNGNWNLESEPIEIRELSKSNYYELKWATKEHNFTITLCFEGNLSSTGSGHFVSKGGGFNEQLLVFANYNPDFQSLKILAYSQRNRPTSYLFEFKKTD